MTYSIVARDATTGELGVAVQSHWFSVGPIVPWARPGVGAVATQANIEPSYGPEALDLLERGMSAGDALSELLARDPKAGGRQVAVLDAQGRVSAYTGPQCMAHAGHVVAPGVSCQANIMGSPSVWSSMLDAFTAASGSLEDRLLDALDAAEAVGGDIRGRQSAALLVVPPDGTPWEANVCLRVEDHPEPLAELRRLMHLHRAYRLADEADLLIGDGRYAEAAPLYERAVEIAPDNHELRFWSGLAAASVGNVESGADQVRQAIAMQPGWGDLLPRLNGPAAPSAPLVHAHLTEHRSSPESSAPRP